MAAFLSRRFPLASSRLLQSTIPAYSGHVEGFSGNVLRSFSSIGTIEQQVVKLEKGGGPNLHDEIRKIRHAYTAAKDKFLKIPDTLKEMPKLDPKGIYVNKNLRLDNIQVYGFDYDYTLAHYSANLQYLIYDLAKEFLVNELRYPDSCLEFKYDNSFPIRGLYYDKSNGCLIKLDFFGSIEPGGCYFGRRKVLDKSICRLNVLPSFSFFLRK